MAFLQVIIRPYRTHQSCNITVQVGFLHHNSKRLELLIMLHRVFHNHIIINSRLPVLQERSDGNHHQLVINSSGIRNRIFMFL